MNNKMKTNLLHGSTDLCAVVETPTFFMGEPIKNKRKTLMYFWKTIA